MSNTAAGLNETEIESEGKAIKVKRADARLLGKALIERVQESDPDLRSTLLPQIQNLEAWIDYDGMVRIGRWLLDNNFGTLAFILRPAPDSRNRTIQYVAPVRFTDKGWVVASVHASRLVPPRR